MLNGDQKYQLYSSISIIYGQVSPGKILKKLGKQNLIYGQID